MKTLHALLFLTASNNLSFAADHTPHRRGHFSWAINPFRCCTSQTTVDESAHRQQPPTDDTATTVAPPSVTHAVIQAPAIEESPLPSMESFEDKHRLFFPRGSSKFWNNFRQMREDQRDPMVQYMKIMLINKCHDTRYEIIESFLALKPDERLPVAEYLSDKVLDLLKYQELEFFILCFKDLPRDQWDAMFDLKTKIQSLIQGPGIIGADMFGEKSATDLLQCIKTIPSKNRLALGQFLLGKPSIKDLNIVGCAENFAKIFNDVPIEQWNDLYAAAEHFLNNHEYMDQDEYLKTIFRFNTSERSKVALFLSERSSWYTAIMETLKKLSFGERLSVIAYIADKVSDLSKEELELFILCFKDLPRGRWDTMYDLKIKIKILIQQQIIYGKQTNVQLLLQGYKPEYIEFVRKINSAEYLLQCIKTIPSKNRLALGQFLLDKPSIKDLNILACAEDFAKIFNDLPIQQWDDLYTAVEKATNNDNFRYISPFLREVAKLMVNERSTVALFLSEKLSNVQFVANFVKMFSGLTLEQMQEMYLAKTLIDLGVQGQHQDDYMIKISNLPSLERLWNTKLAVQIITRPYPFSMGEALIRYISEVPTKERSLRLARGLLFSRGLTDVRHYPNASRRFIQVLESQLTIQIPPINAGLVEVAARQVNPYAAGINVHQGYRDKHTASALKLLWKHTGDLKHDVIFKYYDAFIAHLDAFDNAEEKAAARKSIGLDPASGFGGLLNGPVTTSGLNTTAQELLARLWIFSDEGSAEDQVNKKRGIVTALSKSYERRADTGELSVICNPGKLQHLAVGVLQGYLKGVNIDGTEFVRDVGSAAAGGVAAVAGAALQPARPQPPANRDQMVVNLNQIEQYLKPLFDSFSAKVPTTAAELFDRTFEYTFKLLTGQVPGAPATRLDLREVVYLLRMGKDGKPDVSTSGWLDDIFTIDDYVAQYGERDRQWAFLAGAGLAEIE